MKKLRTEKKSRLDASERASATYMQVTAESVQIVCYSCGMSPETLTTDERGTTDEFDARCLRWLREMSAGSEHALGELYDATLSRVFGVAVKIVGDPTLAENVVTDVYYDIWRNASRYNEVRGRPITWILAICRNRALDEYRRESSAARRVEAATVLDVPETADEPDAILQALEDGRVIKMLLTEISADDGQLIALAFFKGLSHQQIADCVDLPLGTVKSRIRRALSTLSAAAPTEGH